MNDDIGGAFLTDLKKPSSRMNLNSQSPDGRASAARLPKGSAGDMSPSPMNNQQQGSFMNPGMLGSPSSTGQNMLVSFNFLTQVPIDEFVIQEHSKASKLSARLQQNASVKIERELQRKIKEKEKQARLEKVLAAAQLKVKTDVKKLREKVKEKRDKVDEAQNQQKRKMRRDQIMKDRQREQEDKKRKEMIEEAKNGKMASIMKNAEKKAEKILKVEEFKRRMQSEERQRIKEKLELHDLKIAHSTQRNREYLTVRAETVRRRNVSNNEKLMNFRTQEMQQMQETIDSAREKQNDRTVAMRKFYKFELNEFKEAKQKRKEAFEYCRTRQGDNSQAVKQRNRQIMMKLKRSQKQVEEFMRNQNHELMLKQELRKLREDDINKKQIREKRKDTSVKQSIIQKEKDDEKLLKTIRDREQILIETRHNNMMKSNLEKVKHVEKLEQWV